MCCGLRVTCTVPHAYRALSVDLSMFFFEAQCNELFNVWLATLRKQAQGVKVLCNRTSSQCESFTSIAALRCKQALLHVACVHSVVLFLETHQVSSNILILYVLTTRAGIDDTGNRFLNFACPHSAAPACVYLLGIASEGQRSGLSGGCLHKSLCM